MPLISTFGAAGAQSFGNRGLRYGGSAFFNAAGDYLTVPSSSAFTYTGNFTIEMWIYPTNLSVLNLLWRQNNGVYLWISPTGQIGWYHGNSPWGFSAVSVTVNKWNHIAVVRNAGTITTYVNGVGSGSVFNAATVSVGINPLIGTWDGINYQFFGYLTNLRVAKQALYTSDFAPSGIPLTVSSQGSTTTQLLLSTKTPSTLVVDSSANNFALSNVSVTYADFTPFSQPYVTPPVVVLQSATVTPTTVTPSEGTTITFNVVGTNTPNGTYFYTIEEDIATGAVTSADFTSGSLSGTFSISGNSGSFPLTVSRDLLTEGSEEFVIYVRKDSITGGILGTSGNIIITDSSLTPAFTVAPTDINEGTSNTFTVQNIGSDGTYFWTILNDTTTNADFSAASGSFVVSGSTGGLDNGTGSFNITTVSDRVTEGSQTFQVQVRSGSTSGTVVVTSAAVTINDTSLTPSISITGSTVIAEVAPNQFSVPNSTTIEVSNLGPAGTYYYTLEGGVTADDFVGGNSGSFITSTFNGTASFTITAAIDFATESNESFTVRIREGSISGTQLAAFSTLIIGNSTWSVNPNTTLYAEGQTVNITVTAPSPTGWADVGTYWLTFESTGQAVAGDVLGLPVELNWDGTSPSFIVNGIVSIRALDGAEGLETFRLGLRLGTTTGTLVGLSSVISISNSAT